MTCDILIVPIDRFWKQRTFRVHNVSRNLNLGTPYFNLLHIIILWLLFQSLVEINCQIVPFKPKQRSAHTAAVINDKLYIFGGYIVSSTNVTGNKFFYLNLSVPFNTKEPLWQDLSNISNIPEEFGVTSVNGGANNDTLFLYGGSDSVVELVYTFDPQKNSWNIPKITGDSFIKKRSLTGIINNGGMYLWGGLLDAVEYKALDDMLILDTINLSWKAGSSDGAPTPRGQYGAVLLPNNNIIYMGGGGSDNGTALSLNEVYIYNTINNSWVKNITSGTIPSDRVGFSAVLGLDGQRVIIFGGTTTGGTDLTPGQTLYVLNVITFEWNVPIIKNNPFSRVYHTANVIGNYMVVAFGLGYNLVNENDILLLDISNNDEYIWTADFKPLTPTPSLTPTHDEPNNTNNRIIIGIIIGLLISTALLLSLIGYFLRRNRNNVKKREIPHCYSYN